MWIAFNFQSTFSFRFAFVLSLQFHSVFYSLFALKIAVAVLGHHTIRMKFASRMKRWQSQFPYDFLWHKHYREFNTNLSKRLSTHQQSESHRNFEMQDRAKESRCVKLTLCVKFTPRYTPTDWKWSVAEPQQCYAIWKSMNAKSSRARRKPVSSLGQRSKSEPIFCQKFKRKST